VLDGTAEKLVRLMEGEATCKANPCGCIIYGDGYDVSVGASSGRCYLTGCTCYHAEKIALLDVPLRFGLTLMCSLTPCVECAKAIIQSRRIVKVYWLAEAPGGANILRNAKIGACKWPIDSV